MPVASNISYYLLIRTARGTTPPELLVEATSRRFVPVRRDFPSLPSVYGLRRRKNCELFVPGRVTDLLMPSSVTVAELVTQPDGAASGPACSNAKPAVSTAGQETVTFLLERSTESVGSAGRQARAINADNLSARRREIASHIQVAARHHQNPDEERARLHRQFTFHC